MDNKNNTGNENSGNYNSGDWNSGNYNSGDWNSGNCNSGNCNSGDWNSGDRNSGNCNSGNCNSGDWNSGYFNTDEPTVRLFNKETNLKRSEIRLPSFDLKITEWIPADEMSDEAKKADPNFHVRGGQLIKRTYKEAWALYWASASTEDKQMFLDLPNFDAAIFEQITGINVAKTEVSCNGKVVEIDGKKYELKEVK